MSIAVLVLKEKTEASQLVKELIDKTGSTISFQLIKPIKQTNNEDRKGLSQEEDSHIEPIEMDQVELLNPKLSRKRRQRTMALWLMPFGLIAGLTFSQMTGLNTFSELGEWADLAISGLLGLGSGLIGSFFAAASVNSNSNDSLEKLTKRSQEGCWLLVLETPTGIDLPWAYMQQVKPLEVLVLRDI